MRRFFILSVATLFVVAAISSPSVVAALLSSSEDAQHDEQNNQDNNDGEDHYSVTSVMDNKFGVYGGNDGTQRQRRRRRLSIALPGGGCEITWPQPPKKPYETAYAASYPGCGARMTWNLVEALTGLWTGDDWDSNNRGKRVVTIKTHYPHDAGRLVPWDDEINRAMVIIRNPMNAIPSFFNHIYEMKNHLPVHSQRAPVDAWIEWRDRLAAIQIDRFEKFVDYWMERFVYLNDNRIFISYERLTDDEMGPEEAIRMTKFLGQSEGVTPIEIESVPCVWKSVVKYKESLKKTNNEGSRRRRLDPLHHDSQRSGPTERPYTPELLSSMSDMLLNLIRKWGDRHLRLRVILEGYHKDVAAAYLSTTGNNIIAKSSSLGVVPAEKQPQSKNFHIILACPQDMDCSILTNLLVGLFEPEGAQVSQIEDSAQLLVKRSGTIVPIESSVLTTTNDMDLLALYKRIKPKFDEVYFVAPLIGRGELCEYDNVMCVNNDALVYSNANEIGDLVSKISKRLRHHFFEDPAIISEAKQVAAFNRLVAMGAQRADSSLLGVVSLVETQPQSKNFHVILACPQDMDCSILTNVLVGLFEPEGAQVSQIEDSAQLLVKRSGTIVPIESSVLTTTNDMDLLALYKRIKPKFDEVYFVAPLIGRGELCEYDNVMCVNNDALVYSNPDEMEYVVSKIARRLRSHFFEDTTTISEWNQVVALNRLVDMEAHRTDKQGEEKFGIRGGGVSANNFSPPLTNTQGKAPLTINGKSYHIFQASPPHTASTVLNNFLIGMFEPEADYSFMVWDRERRVRRNDKDVSIDDGHIVTKTHILDLMGLYKQHRDKFDEVLFVVANRGVNPETRVDASLCQYNNVLCVEYEELLYSDEQGRQTVVRQLAQKLKGRFNYFFGEHLDLLDSNRLQNAVTRLQQMDQATIALADQPFTVSDNKFGVHGGHRNRDGSEMHGSAGKGKLFYCGGAKLGDRKEFKYSTFGLFLANSLFPEFEGKVQYQPGQTLINTAIALTADSMTKAASKDILIMHSHQKCDVFSLEEFPGKQLHINAEYYDMHPLHGKSLIMPSIDRSSHIYTQN